MTALLVLLGAVKPLAAIVAWGALPLDPDTSLYARGGLGLFPSPLGRLVGIGGVPAIALVNVAANALLVWGAVRVSGRKLAGVVALVSPLGVWSVFWGVDTIAAALLVVAAQARPRAAVLLEVSAVGFHLAALLIVSLSWLTRLSGRVRIAAVGSLALVGTTALAVTPYAGLAELAPATVASGAIATAGVFALTFAPFLLRLRPVVPAIVGGSLAAGLVASSAWETNCRYLLPAVALGAAHGVRGAS